MADPTKQPGLRINQILLEELHFEHCEDWLARPVMLQGYPELPLRIAFRFGRTPDGRGAIVGVTVATPEADDTPEQQSPRYRLKVSVVGFVEAEGEGNIAPDQYVLTTGASLLYPFVREVVANASMRGRFGPIWLKPFNVKIAVDAVKDELLKPANAETEQLERPA